MTAARPRVRPKVSDVVDTPAPMAYDEKARYRRLVNAARRVLPGPVGELVARELDAWHDFGYRLGDQGLMNRLADDIEARAAKERADGDR